MIMKKKLCILLAFAAILCLAACSYNPGELEEKHRKKHEEKCEKVMQETESRLCKKYSDILGNDPDDIVFEVYDLCELADKLNDFGCNNRVTADGKDLCNKTTGLKNMNSDEIREYFEK